jgi:hypothetical protein
MNTVRRFDRLWPALMRNSGWSGVCLRLPSGFGHWTISSVCSDGRRTRPMRPQYLLTLVLTLIIVGFCASCSRPKAEAHRTYSVGTSGTVIVTCDGQQRVLEVRQFNPDQSLKLSITIIYAKRDIERLSVFDSKGRQVWRSVFTSSGASGRGRDSEVPSPGWDIRTEGNYSGVPGDIHNTTSWFCGDDLLYRLKRTWPDDRSRVYYEVAGPSGVILFTNSYSER